MMSLFSRVALKQKFCRFDKNNEIGVEEQSYKL